MERENSEDCLEKSVERDISLSRDTLEHSKSKSNQESLVQQNKKEKPEDNLSLSSVTTIFFVILAFLAIFKQWSSDPIEKGKCSISTLKKRYPNQKGEFWHQLEVGIEMILNEKSDQPGVYLFLQDDKNESIKLIKEVAEWSSQCLDPNSKPIEMKNDFISSDAIVEYGNAIEKYKEKIKNGNIILIADLHEIPAEAARALHTICDTHTPIYPKVIIFLTLVTPQNKIEGNPVSIAVDVLTELWGGKLRDNELSPLITRVTDQVLHIKSK